METDDGQLSILTAKVVMLERLVRALLKERFMGAADPLASLVAYRDRFLQSTSDHFQGEPNDVAELLLIGNAEKLFDQLEREIRKAGRSPISTRG